LYAGCVCGRLTIDDYRRHRPDADDDARAAGGHLGADDAAALPEPVDVDVPHRAPLVVGHVERRTVEAHAGVVDQHVDGAELPGHRVQHGFDARAVRDVGADGHRVQFARDRDGSFEPVIVRKRERRLDGIDQIVLSLTAGGLTTGEISAHFREVYGASVGKGTISRITASVVETMSGWQNRPLDRGLSGGVHRRVRPSSFGPTCLRVGTLGDGRREWRTAAGCDCDHPTPTPSL
jgi:hypothetical protein